MPHLPVRSVRHKKQPLRSKKAIKAHRTRPKSCVRSKAGRRDGSLEVLQADGFLFFSEPPAPVAAQCGAVAGAVAVAPPAAVAAEAAIAAAGGAGRARPRRQPKRLRRRLSS